MFDFSKLDADNTLWNICSEKSKVGRGNTFHLRKHLVKHKIHVKAEVCLCLMKVKPPAAVSANISTIVASATLVHGQRSHLIH